MKKLLILLFSILISFNSYGEWTKVTKSTNGATHYVDIDTIKEHNGYVNWWELGNFPKDKDGDMSSKGYIQGDCGQSRHKILAVYFYKKPMGNGESIQVNGDGKWDYLPPDTIGLTILNFVCDYVNQ